jgi:D-alanyl-D-alanine-carboxypeptidase/D-alanyl-D-alanine-endopeptidase
LLGHIIALKTGKSYETLVANWICNPLGMDSTRISLSPELKARSVVGHSCYGDAQSDLVFSEVLMGGGALHSTANDLLKYLSANLDLSHSPLTPAMRETHDVRFQNQGLGWAVSGDTLFHNGMTLGCTSSIAFDTKRRRGVVILSNQAFDPEAQNLVSILLRSEWNPEKRPKAVAMDDRTLDSYVGRYQLGDKLAAAVRREGHRLLVQMPTMPLLEILPKSKTDFFLRVSCRPVTFQQDAQGKAQTMSADFNGAQSTFTRISDLPPDPLQVQSHPVIITETPESHAAFWGTFILPSKRIVTVSQEGDHLLVVYQGWMGFYAYPQSENRICCTYVPWEATLKRNSMGEPTGITLACQLFEKQFIGNAVKIVPK